MSDRRPSSWRQPVAAARKLARAMKGWLVGLALVVVVAASGVGLWATWDSTQTTSADAIADPDEPRLRPPTTTAHETTTTIPDAPACAVGDEPVATDPETDWDTTVVDTEHGLPADFVPSDLVDATEAGFESRDQVRAIVIEDLAALRQAAEDNGTPIVVVSGYRSHSYQQQLFDRRAAEVGEAEAAQRTARPGHSEHQLGTAIDVLEPGTGELTTGFATTPAGQWLAANAHEYGFVISYPEGLADRTCYEYEPWHLRYVGREAAADIVESGATPREWMLARATTDG
jgi:D-alanyl-D-alanine carboxypeptidase